MRQRRAAPPLSSTHLLNGAHAGATEVPFFGAGGERSPRSDPDRPAAHDLQIGVAGGVATGNRRVGDFDSRALPAVTPLSRAGAPSLLAASVSKIVSADYDEDIGDCQRKSAKSNLSGGESLEGSPTRDSSSLPRDHYHHDSH